MKPSAINYQLLPEVEGDQHLFISISATKGEVFLCNEESTKSNLITLPWHQAEKMCEAITSAIKHLAPSGYPVGPLLSPEKLPDVRPGPMTYVKNEEKSLTEKYLHPTDPSLPVAVNIPSTSTYDPDLTDDPNIVYLIRHEYKDLYLTDDDIHQSRRACTGDKSQASCFRTRYAARREMQAMRHPCALIESPATYIVTWRCSENDVLHFFNGEPPGSIHRSQATHMTREEADNLLPLLPDPWIKTILKVWR